MDERIEAAQRMQDDIELHPVKVFDKFQFFELIPYVTFLCPNKKVTKEVV